MKMNVLIVLLLAGSLLSNHAFAQQANIEQQCQYNGFAPNLIKKTITNIKTAIANKKYTLLAQQFHYPLRVNTKDGPIMITAASEFIKLAPKLFSKNDINEIKSQNAYFCNYRGVAFANIWMGKFDKPSVIKGFAIYSNKSLQLPIKQNQDMKKISPIYKVSILKKFISMYNNVPHSMSRAVYKLYNNRYLIDQWGDTIDLYNVDINNDGKKEWITIYRNVGSAATSGIYQIFSEDNNRLIPLKFDALVMKQFKLSDLSQWYLHMATPALVEKNSLIYMNFGATPPICTYLWKNNAIKLVHEVGGYCLQ